MLSLSRLESLAPGLRSRRPLRHGRAIPRPSPASSPATPTPALVLLADPGPEPDISMLDTAMTPPALGGARRRPLRDPRRSLTSVKAAPHDAHLPQHARAGRDLLPPPLARINDDSLPIGIHHGSLAREQRERVEQAMVDGPTPRDRLHRIHSISASTGAMSISSSRSARRRTSSGSCSASVAPTTATTRPRRRSSCPPTASRSSNAARRSTPSAIMTSTVIRAAPARAMCSASTSSASPARAPSMRRALRRGHHRRPLRRPRPPRSSTPALEFVATGGYALRAYDRWQRLMHDQRTNGTCATRARPRSSA